MPGESKVVIGDADVVMALANSEDKLYTQATAGTATMAEAGAMILFPPTAITEAITTFQRVDKKPELAAFVKEQYQQELYAIADIDKEVLDDAVNIFNPYGSIKNTVFDAVVAATAKKYNAVAVFSFDEWYTKGGFKLTVKITDLIIHPFWG